MNAHSEHSEKQSVEALSVSHVYLSIFSCLMLLNDNFLKILPRSDGHSFFFFSNPNQLNDVSQRKRGLKNSAHSEFLIVTHSFCMIRPVAETRRAQEL